MEKKIKILIGILIVGIVLFSGWQILKKQTHNCPKWEQEINILLEQANYCDKDYDCIISDEFERCPLDCHTLFNKNADLTSIRISLVKYNIFCLMCYYKCPDLITQDKDVICKNNKCIYSRYEK
ncbi:MAG: hypothetical protein U9Q92_03720 [archaeon]|nr:hypothetical protein [archaeon]